MLINNIYAILTHILCIIFTFIIAILVKNHVIVAMVLSIFILSIYILFGIKLKSQGSIINNLLSVSSVGIIGLIFWVLGLGKGSVSSTFWEIHLLFISPVSIIALMLPKSIMKYILDHLLVPFISTLIPTILMWIGLLWKTRRLKQHNSVNQ